MLTHGFASLVLLGAAFALGAVSVPEYVPSGAWGGQHVSLDAGEKGATLDFDCAHGSVDRPLPLDREGRFDVAGVYVQESMGPERADRPPAQRAARYKGRIDGKTMTLTVVLGEGETVGPFTLTHSKPGIVRKCG